MRSLFFAVGLTLVGSANGQCDTSTPPKNGGKGNCQNTLAVNATCQPTCGTGYTVSGKTSCYLGKLSAASCQVSKNYNTCSGGLVAPSGAVIVNASAVPHLLTGADISAHLKAKAGYACSGTALAYCAANGTGKATAVEFSCGDLDSCATKPCGTGAACIDVAAPNNGYSCYCKTGYSGSNTSNSKASCKDTDGCVNIACGKGATCVDESAPGEGYTCKCNEGQYTGTSRKNNQASCTVNPECPQVKSTGKGSICDCQLDLGKTFKDYSGQSFSPPTKAAKCQNTAGSRTIDKLAATLTAEAQAKNKLRVCATATCKTSDCCISFVPCPANSGTKGAGHGDKCPCHTGYRGTNGGADPAWDQKKRVYIGACEPTPCPDHPRWPSSVGGKKADGTGQTACSCADGYSVKPHCRVEASSACLNAPLTGSKSSCESAGECDYVPKKDSIAASCKTTVSCSASTKTDCESFRDGRGKDTKSCSWTDKVQHTCVHKYDTQCKAKNSKKTECLAIRYKGSDGKDVTNNGNAVSACKYDDGSQACTPSMSCSANANGKQPDGSKADCEDKTVLSGGEKGLVCKYTAAIPGKCANTASCSNVTNCKTAAGCTLSPFVPSIAEKCKPKSMRTTKASCELKSAGNKWTPAVPAKCSGGKTTPLSNKPNNEKECENTGNTWSVGSCANCQNACNDATTKDKCEAQGGTWTAAKCSDGKTAKQQDCEYTGNQWSVGSPSSCSAKGNYANPRNTKELCENDLTGLLWDAGSCKRMVPAFSTAKTCEFKASGYKYVPKVDYAKAKCINPQGQSVSGDTKDKCEGAGSGFTWKPGSCSDNKLTTETSCTKTGNSWKPATAGYCTSGSNQNKLVRVRTCTSTNSSYATLCGNVDITGACATAMDKCTSAHSSCVFTMEATTKDECESHDLEDRNHAHGRKWIDGDDNKGACKKGDTVIYNTKKSDCTSDGGTWSPGLCEGDTGASQANCSDWKTAKCSDNKSANRNVCVCGGGVWQPARCHGLVYAADKGKCIGTGDKWTPAVQDVCIDGSTSTNTQDKCIAANKVWSTARSGCTVAQVTSKSKCEDTTNTWTADKCLSGSTTITSFCSTSLLSKTSAKSKTSCEDTGLKWTSSNSSCSGNNTAAKSQASCEKTGNTWVTPTSGPTCIGKTGSKFTAEVLAAKHKCTKGSAAHSTWSVNSGTKDGCELVASGNEYSATTNIVFKSEKYAGICTPKVCALPTVQNGKVTGEAQHTGIGITITCDAGYEPSGDAGPSKEEDCKKAGYTWMPKKCTAYSAAKCTAFTTPKCVVTHLTCLATANWNKNVAKCVAKSCGSVTTSHGKITGPVVYKQTGSLSVKCNAGYEVVGMANDIETRGYGQTKSFTCGSSGTWDKVPVCRALRCPSYCGDRACTTEENARAAPCTNPPCTTGSASRTPTLENGWIHEMGVPIDIAPDGRNRNKPGDRTYSPSGASGSGWAFTCNNKTKLVGASTSVCRQDGTWSNAVPHCELITWCELPSWAGKQTLTEGGARLGTKAYNIEDCWYPKSRIYARHSPAHIKKYKGTTEFNDLVKQYGSSVEKSTCKVRCFPTCLGTGKDKDGKPCVDAKGSIETTWTCEDGGEWSSAVNGKVVTHKGGRTSDTSGGYPACQRAPFQATSAATTAATTITSTVVLALLGLWL